MKPAAATKWATLSDIAARVLLYASSHRQANTYHGLCYNSRGALGERHLQHLCKCIYIVLYVGVFVCLFVFVFLFCFGGFVGICVCVCVCVIFWLYLLLLLLLLLFFLDFVIVFILKYI